MKQVGRYSRLTAEQIERVRDVHRRWYAVRIERMRVQAEFGITATAFSRIGRHVWGKKPRAA